MVETEKYENKKVLNQYTFLNIRILFVKYFVTMYDNKILFMITIKIKGTKMRVSVKVSTQQLFYISHKCVKK